MHKWRHTCRYRGSKRLYENLFDILLILSEVYERDLMKKFISSKSRI